MQKEIYILACEGNYRIRKIDITGIITTIAGNGDYGYSGDGGLAINARLTEPNACVLDANGNIYIADVFSHRIRKIKK